MKNRQADVLLAAVTFSLTIFFFIPISIYLLNRESISAHDVFMVLFWLVLSIGVFMVVATPLLLLSDKAKTWGIILAAFFAAAFWIQTNIFNWDYGLLDGTELPWQLFDWRSVVDLGAWALMLGLILFLGRANLRVLRILFLILLFIQCGNLIYVYSIARTQNLKTDRRIQEIGTTPANKFNFSKEKNIIVLVLDAYQSDLFLESIETDLHLAKALRGFTYYPDALAVGPGTQLTLPLLLTGAYYTNQMPMTQFLEEAHRDHSLAELLQNSGYITGFYPDYWDGKGLYRHEIKISASNIKSASDTKAEATYTEGVREVGNLALLRVVPHALKKQVFDNIFVRTSFDEDRDQFLYDMGKTARVDMAQPKLTWYHLKGIHQPWIVDGAELSRGNRKNAMMVTQCVNTLIANFMEQLKALEIYDESAILIFGDHGHGSVCYTDNTLEEKISKAALKACFDGGTAISASRNIFGWVWERALPLVLFKPFNATHEFDISCAPISLADIYPTILDLAGIEQYRELPGVSLLQPSLDNPRLRNIFFYSFADRKERPKGYFTPIYEYEVAGFSWHKRSNTYTGNKYELGRRVRQPLDIYTLGRTLSFGMAGTGIQYLDDNWQREKNSHKTSGACAGLHIMVQSADKDLLLHMEVDVSPLPGRLNSQHVSLYAAEIPLGSFEITKKTTLQMVVPKDVISNDLLTLRLALPENSQPKPCELVGEKTNGAIRLYSLTLKVKE